PAKSGPGHRVRCAQEAPMTHSTADVDPARPIPPIEQPARLAALAAAVRARTSLVPELGIVLGSGLGGLADELSDAVAIPFADLPRSPPAAPPSPLSRAARVTLSR